jgi:alpha-galactosidase
LAVWRIGGEQDTIALPIHFVRGQQVNAFCLYPAGKGCRFSYDEGKLYIELQPKTARIFEIDLE